LKYKKRYILTKKDCHSKKSKEENKII
jgi:hypothetical protein